MTSFSTTPDNVRVNHFQNGSIYWSVAGTHEIHGAIRDKWMLLVGNDFLGYPVTDESSTPDGIGRFNHFQNGSIYWTPDTGAHSVRGGIRDKWEALGWERSYLGYPVSDQILMEDSGKRNRFQRGEILQTSNGVPFDIPDSIEFNSGSIITDDTIGGSIVWLMNSRGDWTWTGHMHNSGFLSLSVSVVSRLNFVDSTGQGFAVSKDGSVAGTAGSGSRDLDWQDGGLLNDVIRSNWDAIRTTGITTRVEVGTTVGQVLEAIFLGIFIAGVVLFISDDRPVKAKKCPRPGNQEGSSVGDAVFWHEGDPEPMCYPW